jgi:hypothetical protein
VPLETAVDNIAAHAEVTTDERHDLPLMVEHSPMDEQDQPVRLLLTRWFNGPSNLQPGQPVGIHIEPAQVVAGVRLNADALHAHAQPSGGSNTPAALRFDLTDKLQRHNRLDILVGDHAGLSSANIALVIEDDRQPLEFDRFAAP